MLGSARLTAFVATTDSARSRPFYESVLGLRFLSDDRFALVFDSNGTTLRIQKVERFQPLPFTALGWQVAGIQHVVSTLTKLGVAFERYSFLQQDGLGIWTSPAGAKVAWFKDPDGNLLSVWESGAAE